MPMTAEKIPAPSATREPFGAFVCDEVTRAAAARAADDKGWSGAQILDGGITKALAVLPNIPTPRFLVVDFSDSRDPVAEASNLALVCDENTRVIALGTVNDIHLFRELIELGVEDYLLKPVSVEALSAAITREVPTPKPVESEETKGRLVTVIGARGGVGSTTVAVNTAWMMAHDRQMRIALVDLDLHFGTVALSLDVEPGRGFSEAIESPSRIDGLFMERAMTRAAKNLFVLGTERRLDQIPHPTAQAIDPLLSRLRNDFDGIVVDIPRRVALAVPGLLAESQTIVLVADLSLAGMRDALRISEFLRAASPEAALKIVVNRAGQMKKAELDSREFERSVEAPIAALLPDDPKTTAKSAGMGRPFVAVAPKGRYAAALRPLSLEISGVENPEKMPLWKKLTGKKR